MPIRAGFLGEKGHVQSEAGPTTVRMFRRVEQRILDLDALVNQIRNDALTRIRATASISVRKDSASVDVGTEPRLNFVAGNGITQAVTDVPADFEVKITTAVNPGFGLEFSGSALVVDQDMVPTWTGVHTFSAQDVHNAGISLGTSGALVSAVADGASTVGFDLNDGARTTGYARSLRRGTTYLENVTWDGRFTFGYGPLASVTPLAGHVLSFTAADSNSPTGAPIRVGILGYVVHDDSTETVTNNYGVVGAYQANTATGASWTRAAGLQGSIGTTTNFTTGGGLSSKSGAAVGASFATETFGSQEPATIDQPYAKSAQPDGDWGHLTGFWCDFLQITSTANLAATRPAIVSSARLPIQYYSGSTAAATPNGTSCAIYGEDPNTGTPLYPANTYFARIPYPRKTGGTGVHAAHLFFEVWPNTSTIRGGGQSGDVYFESGTNFPKGLWQYAGAWGRLRDSSTTTQTANYTAADPSVILCNATSGSFTVTLPAAAAAIGKVYTIKKIDGTANTVTVDGNASETIDDATTQVLTAAYTSIDIVSDGTEWWIV